MTTRIVIAFVAFTVLWVAGVGAITQPQVRSEMRRLGTAADGWLHVAQRALH